MQLVEELLIHLVETLSGRELGRDGVVDLRLRESLQRKRGLADDGKRPHLRRVIAFVGASYEIGPRAKGVSDLSGGGKKRDVARHAGNLLRRGTLLRGNQIAV